MLWQQSGNIAPELAAEALLGVGSPFGIRPITLRSSADDILNMPRVISIRLADTIPQELLQEKKLEDHVLPPLFTLFKFTEHAELWLTKLWQESVSRRLYIKEQAAADRQAYALRDELVTLLIARLPRSLGLSMAYIIAHDIRAGTFDTELANLMKITDLYERYVNTGTAGHSKLPPTSNNAAS